jgi:NTE family protein
MKALTILYEWMFKRLPKRFSIPMLIFVLLYFILLFPWLVYRGNPQLTEFIIGYFNVGSIPWTWLHGKEIISALLTIIFGLSGIVLSYGGAGLLYRLWRSRPMSKIEIQTPHLPAYFTDEDIVADTNPLKKYKRIGIILAGGGAKGAYQAGSLKAIYEFLDENKAHHKVKMIAGTSIGSWNALFWLANLIKAPDGTKGLHELWWENVDVQNVICPAFYIPARQNYFLSNKPWQETFDTFFIKNKEAHERLTSHINNQGDQKSINFYFTRANIERAHLEFSTNRRDLSKITPNMDNTRRPRPAVPSDIWKAANSVEDIRSAVFASMDLPPLFENVSIDDEYFEDGGVIDNLPVRFGTEIEQCDLLFILPLNASFDEDVNVRSVLKRMYRVMDARQGVLERNSFKMLYLYNELADLRKRSYQMDGYRNIGYALHKKWHEYKDREGMHPEVKKIFDEVFPKDFDANASDALMKNQDSAADRALKREHKMVQVFAICPAPELAINTSEFWKTKEAGKAFRLMYDYTKIELQKFDFMANPGWIRMALVGRHGQVTYLEDF